MDSTSEPELNEGDAGAAAAREVVSEDRAVPAQKGINLITADNQSNGEQMDKDESF